MIDVSMDRSKFKNKSCNGCQSNIEKDAPIFILSWAVGTNIQLVLCEDCGNNLQNDINDEYQNFVDLEM